MRSNFWFTSATERLRTLRPRPAKKIGRLARAGFGSSRAAEALGYRTTLSRNRSASSGPRKCAR